MVEVQTVTMDMEVKTDQSLSGYFSNFWNLPFKLKQFIVTGIGMTTLDVVTDLVQAFKQFV